MSGVPAFKLVEAGFSQPQVEALSEFMQTEAARRSDLMEVEHRLDTSIAEVKATLRLHNWMISFNIGLTLLVLGKLFLHP
jgi:hypothetical protein